MSPAERHARTRNRSGSGRVQKKQSTCKAAEAESCSGRSLASQSERRHFEGRLRVALPDPDRADSARKKGQGQGVAAQVQGGSEEQLDVKTDGAATCMVYKEASRSK